jgi:hypothetical protein
MAHSCPDGYLPINDAFEQACSELEGGGENLVRLVDEATAATDDERADRWADRVDELGAAHLRVDTVRWRVERLMRDALADGRLDVFYRAPSGEIERLLDREEWRREAFGIPDIANIAHPVTSPGPDTEGQPVLLKISDFQRWLTTHRYEIHPFRTGLPGRPTAIQLIEAEHQRRIDSGKALDKVGEEAKHLEKWLVTTHPRAPRTTAKTIENRIRKAHRNRART